MFRTFTPCRILTAVVLAAAVPGTTLAQERPTEQLMLGDAPLICHSTQVPKDTSAIVQFAQSDSVVHRYFTIRVASSGHVLELVSQSMTPIAHNVQSIRLVVVNFVDGRALSGTFRSDSLGDVRRALAHGIADSLPGFKRIDEVDVARARAFAEQLRLRQCGR